MKSHLLGATCAALLGFITVSAHAALIATNIAGSDGSISLVNATDVPLVISNIQGLALTNPAAPGNNRVITGKNNIFEFVAGFFQSIKAIRHKNLEVYELEGIRFVLGNVTYTRLDGSTLSVDFSNTFRLNGNKIKDYLIFIDNSELFR